MRRFVVLAALAVAALLASRADAIEMFTNFNNGTNVGFPPMEVPVGIYRGFGRGGWNPHAEGTFFRSNPPVPAMTPTGQLPRPEIRTSGVSERTFSSVEKTSEVQYVSDRRRSGRFQRTPNSTPSTNSIAPSNSMPASPSNETTIQGNTTGPTPAKAPEMGDALSASPSTKSNKAQQSVTVLRAQSGKSPIGSTPTSNANSSGDEDFLPANSSALFPNSTN
jgi:hypothetical protein